MYTCKAQFLQSITNFPSSSNICEYYACEPFSVLRLNQLQDTYNFLIIKMCKLCRISQNRDLAEKICFAVIYYLGIEKSMLQRNCFFNAHYSEKYASIISSSSSLSHRYHFQILTYYIFKFLCTKLCIAIMLLSSYYSSKKFLKYAQ